MLSVSPFFLLPCLLYHQVQYIKQPNSIWYINFAEKTCILFLLFCSGCVSRRHLASLSWAKRMAALQLRHWMQIPPPDGSTRLLAVLVPADPLSRRTGVLVVSGVGRQMGVPVQFVAFKSDKSLGFVQVVCDFAARWKCQRSFTLLQTFNSVCRLKQRNSNIRNTGILVVPY